MAGLRLKIAALVLLVLAVAGGCASLAELAPPVDQAMVTAAARLGGDRAALERGRHLYVGDCAKCHAPVAVGSLSREEWAEVLPRMNDLTRLDEQARRDLAAYIEIAGSR